MTDPQPPNRGFPEEKERHNAVRRVLDKGEPFLDDGGEQREVDVDEEEEDDDVEEEEGDYHSGERETYEEEDGEDEGPNDDCVIELNISRGENCNVAVQLVIDQEERFVNGGERHEVEVQDHHDGQEDEEDGEEEGDSENNTEQEKCQEDEGDDEGVNADRVLESHSPQAEDRGRFIQRVIDEARFLDEGEQQEAGIVDDNYDAGREEEDSDGDDNDKDESENEGMNAESQSGRFVAGISRNWMEEDGDQKRRRVQYAGRRSQESEGDPNKLKGFLCCICMQAWVDSDDHHTCRLPCGHLFGRTCFIKWLETLRNPGPKEQCPQCIRMCSLNDSGKDHASQVAAMDDESSYQLAGEDPATTWAEGEASRQPRERFLDAAAAPSGASVDIPLTGVLDSVTTHFDLQIVQLMDRLGSLDHLAQRLANLSNTLTELHPGPPAASAPSSRSSAGSPG